MSDCAVLAGLQRVVHHGTQLATCPIGIRYGIPVRSLPLENPGAPSAVLTWAPYTHVPPGRPPSEGRAPGWWWDDGTPTGAPLRGLDGTPLGPDAPDDVVVEAVSATAAWPFDADRWHPLAARRIPVIHSVHPSWHYEVAVVIGPEYPFDHLRGLEPTDHEADLIVSYLTYRLRWYSDSYRAQIRKRPLDVDSSTNTTVLIKTGEDDWHFRRASWAGGVLIWPSLVSLNDEPVVKFGLADVLDYVTGGLSNPSREWAKWKTAHAETHDVGVVLPGLEGAAR